MAIINQVVSGGGGSSVAEPYLELQVDANGKLIHSKTTSRVVDLSSVTDLSTDYILYCAYKDNTNISGVVNMSNVKTINGDKTCYYAFAGCTGITGANLSSWGKNSIGNSCQYMFQNCTGLITVILDNVEQIVGCGYMFSGCTNLTTANMPKLVALSSNNAFGYGFENTSITSYVFSSLKYMNANNCCGYVFKNCPITSLSFPAVTTSSFPNRTDQIMYIVNGVDGCTIHFPKNLDPQTGSTTISGLFGYPNFGGTNTTVLFDLPSTAHLIGNDSVEYERSPKDDTLTALAWRVKDTGTAPNFVVVWTPYYTSGTTDPQVNDTIYSDAACQTAVTTITAIA